MKSVKINTKIILKNEIRGFICYLEKYRRILKNILYKNNIRAVFDTYGIERAVVLSNEREIIHKGKITYLPIYYVMFM